MDNINGFTLNHSKQTDFDLEYEIGGPLDFSGSDQMTHSLSSLEFLEHNTQIAIVLPLLA